MCSWNDASCEHAPSLSSVAVFVWVFLSNLRYYVGEVHSLSATALACLWFQSLATGKRRRQGLCLSGDSGHSGLAQMTRTENSRFLVIRMLYESRKGQMYTRYRLSICIRSKHISNRSVFPVTIMRNVCKIYLFKTSTNTLIYTYLLDNKVVDVVTVRQRLHVHTCT